MRICWLNTCHSARSFASARVSASRPNSPRVTLMQRHLHRHGALAPDLLLRIQAAVLLLCVAVGLRVLPLRTVQRALNWALPPSAPPTPPDSLLLHRVESAVVLPSRWVPGARCLPRAMTAQLLLARRGHYMRVCVSVRRDKGRLCAHAWLCPIGTSAAREASAATLVFTPRLEPIGSEWQLLS
jgi:hypothetical protein